MQYSRCKLAEIICKHKLFRTDPRRLKLHRFNKFITDNNRHSLSKYFHVQVAGDCWVKIDYLCKVGQRTRTYLMGKSFIHRSHTTHYDGQTVLPYVVGTGKLIAIEPADIMKYTRLVHHTGPYHFVNSYHSFK